MKHTSVGHPISSAFADAPWRRGRVQEPVEPMISKREAQRLAWIVRLKHFEQEHGHFDVPRTGDTADLARWIDKLLSHWRRQRNMGLFNLIADVHPKLLLHIQKLDKTSQWHVRSEHRNRSFLASMRAYLVFVAEHGRKPMRSRTCVEEELLAKWIYRAFSGARKTAERPQWMEVARMLKELDCSTGNLDSRCAAVDARLTDLEAAEWRGAEAL